MAHKIPGKRGFYHARPKPDCPACCRDQGWPVPPVQEPIMVNQNKSHTFTPATLIGFGVAAAAIALGASFAYNSAPLPFATVDAASGVTPTSDGESLPLPASATEAP